MHRIRPACSGRNRRLVEVAKVERRPRSNCVMIKLA
jgi:hypothetical protein